VVLRTPGSADGFNGTASSISGFFSNIDALVGGPSSADSIIALGSGGRWNVGATDTYHNGNDLTFSGFEQLHGGTGDTFNISGAQLVSVSADAGRFVFADGASITGSIDGGGTSRSTIDWSASSTPRNVTLKSPGASHGFNGTEASIGGGFTNIDSLIAAGTVMNVLTGLNAAANWSLLGAIDTYERTNTLTFHGFVQLHGGAVRDDFAISGQNDVSLSGGGVPRFSSSTTGRA
jgi:hypothetical protein